MAPKNPVASITLTDMQPLNLAHKTVNQDRTGDQDRLGFSVEVV